MPSTPTAKQKILLAAGGFLAVVLLGWTLGALAFFATGAGGAPGGAGSAAPPPEPPPEPVVGTLHLEIESPLPPSAISVAEEGEPLFAVDDPGPLLEVEVENFVQALEGVRMDFAARWSDHLPGPRAVRVRATLDGAEISEAVFWGADESIESAWFIPPPQKP